CDVVGPKSNVPFLERLVMHPAVRDGSIDTGYLDRHLDEFLDQREMPPVPAVAAAAAVAMDSTVVDTRAHAAQGADPHSPWALADGWRLGHASAQAMALSWREQRLDVIVQGDPKRFVLRHGEARHDIEVLH